MKFVIKAIGSFALVSLVSSAFATKLDDAVKVANISEMSRIYASKEKPLEVTCVVGGVTRYGISCLYSYAVSELYYDEKYKDKKAEADRLITAAAALMKKNGARGPSGDSLYNLVAYGFSSSFSQAISFGADVKVENIGGSKLNICQLAYVEGHPEICDIAIKHGHREMSKREVLQLDLTKAIKDLDIYAVDAAIERGASVSVQAPNGETPLYTAVDFMFVSPEEAAKIIQIIEHLISKGAKPSGVYARYGLDYPLHHAINHAFGNYAKFSGDEAPLIEVSAVLIRAGAEVSGRDAEGNTPLHYAAKQGLIGTVKLLLLSGAYPLSKNEKGQMPIDIAGKRAIIDLLRSVGDGKEVPVLVPGRINT